MTGIAPVIGCLVVGVGFDPLCCPFCCPLRHRGSGGFWGKPRLWHALVLILGVAFASPVRLTRCVVFGEYFANRARPTPGQVKERRLVNALWIAPLALLVALLVYSIGMAEIRLRQRGRDRPARSEPPSLTKRVARRIWRGIKLLGLVFRYGEDREGLEPLRGWGRVAGFVAFIGIIAGCVVVLILYADSISYRVP